MANASFSNVVQKTSENMIARAARQNQTLVRPRVSRPRPETRSPRELTEAPRPARPNPAPQGFRTGRTIDVLA